MIQVHKQKQGFKRQRYKNIKKKKKIFVLKFLQALKIWLWHVIVTSHNSPSVLVPNRHGHIWTTTF